MALVTLVYRSGTMVLPFLSLYLTKARGFSTTQAGWTLSLYGLGALGGTYIGGWLCDVVGPLRVMGVSLLLSAVALWVLGFLASPWTIGVALFALSLVAEAFRPASGAAAAAFAAPDQRVRAVALRRLAINVGMTLGPAIGGFLAVIDYFWLFVVDGAACFLAGGLAWLFFHRQIRAVQRSTSEQTTQDRRSPWSDGVFLLMLLLSLAFAIIFFQVFVTFPLTLRDLYGMTEDRIGIMIAINALTIVVVEMVLTRSLLRRAPLRMMGLGAFFACLGLGLLPLGSTSAFVVMCVLILTLGEMFYAPFGEGFVVNRAEAHNRGKYMGMYTLSWSAAFALAPMLGTRVYDHFGPTWLWYSCGGMGLLLFAGFFALAARASQGQAVPAVLLPAHRQETQGEP